MDAVKHLLQVYAAVMVVNVALSAFLWSRHRTALLRSLALVWASSILTAVVQSALVGSPLKTTLGFASSFPINLALADLLGRVVDVRPPWKVYLGVFVAGLACSATAGFVAAPFWIVALPTGVALSVPLLHSPCRAWRARAPSLTATGKGAALSYWLYGLHQLDYAFLRDKPELSGLGFSLALVVLFAISITIPAVVLERVTADRARAEGINRLQRQFFANITHELRTPLTMILAPIESLLAGQAGSVSPALRAHLDPIRRNGLRLLRLVNDLLDLAKLNEGFMRLRLDRSDIRQVLENVVAYSRPLAAHKGVALDLAVESEPRELHVDVEKIERVVVNLIANALKFTDRGAVRVILRSASGAVEIAVEDTGCGIPREHLGDIFGRFVQADASSTRRHDGTGIGLAIVKEIVELHGGRVTVTSTAGQGSRFVVHLREGVAHIPPAALDRRDAASATDSSRRTDDLGPREWTQEIQRRKEYRFGGVNDATDRRRVSRSLPGPRATRVLVVEDNPDVLELVNIQLQGDHGILTAQDGRQGLALAAREAPDLIVTDFMMPEMDGLDMLRALRADPRTADTPVVMLTSKSQVEDRLQAREAGADVYLTKPFSGTELHLAVRQLLEKRGRQVGHLMRAHVEGLGSVSAGLAHELHNALNYIKSSNNIVQENVGRLRELLGCAGAPDSRGDAIAMAQARIDRVVDAAGRGIARIEGVVNLVQRYARDGYPTEPADYVLDDAVGEVVALVAPKGDDECAVVVKCAAPAARVRCIPEEMNQVIRNLVENAIAAAGPTGQVHVATRNEPKALVLEVSDNGPGIAPEDRAKIFAPFFTTKASGMGMGLAIVHRVVTSAGGSVEVESRPGEGATFKVLLPAGGNARAPAA